MEGGPHRKPLAQSPDQLASKTRQSQHRPSREVVPVQHDHRRSAGDCLAHKSTLDELLDDGAGVAGSDTSSSSELPPGDRLFEPRQCLKKRPSDGGSDVKNG
jgi:hypothetical protein